MGRAAEAPYKQDHVREGRSQLEALTAWSMVHGRSELMMWVPTISAWTDSAISLVITPLVERRSERSLLSAVALVKSGRMMSLHSLSSNSESISVFQTAPLSQENIEAVLLTSVNAFLP